MATKKAASVAESAVDKIKPPITFKEFAKEPVKGLLFLCILAVGYMYIDIKKSAASDKEFQTNKIEKLEGKIDDLAEHVRLSDSAKAAAMAKNEIITQLSKIKD